MQAPPTRTSQRNNREILLELGKRTISLREIGKVIGSWPVAIGDPSTPTPVGRFTLQNKVVNPKYQSTKSRDSFSDTISLLGNCVCQYRYKHHA